MIISKKNVFIVLAFLTIPVGLKAQEGSSSVPILVEFMGGNDYTSYQSMFSKPLFNSKFSFYNLTYFEIDYDKSTSNYYYVQGIASYGLPKGFSVGLGANLESYVPFQPLVAVSYSHFNENVGLFIQPSYELHEDGIFELYAMFEWVAKGKRDLKFYFKGSGYTSLKTEHIYSYLFLRPGFNYKDFRFGPALNMQFYGTDFESKTNVGAFINVLLF